MTSTPHNTRGLYNTEGRIRTYSGFYIDPLNPDPGAIDIRDIAHALTNQCRFAGHTQRRFSVAQHSIMVADSVPQEHKLAALLHDASEAYLLDIPTPVKAQLSGYMEAEDRLMQVIAKKFGFAYPLHMSIKAADKNALEWEWHNCVVNDNIETWDRKSTEELFLWRFREYSAQ